jgi:hypothetical protein
MQDLRPFLQHSLRPRRSRAQAGSAVALETGIATKATADVGCQISDSFFGIGFGLALARPSGVSFGGDCLMPADRQCRRRFALRLQLVKHRDRDPAVLAPFPDRE